jgi:hypothetical protein
MVKQTSRKVKKTDMHFFDVMYYYYYVFYRFIYREPDPEITAKLSLSASESFLVNAVTSIPSAYFLGYKFGRVEFISITALILVLNFTIFLKPKREKKILQNEPKLFGSNNVSVVIAWFFFLSTCSILFWLNDAVNFFIDIHR